MNSKYQLYDHCLTADHTTSVKVKTKAVRGLFILNNPLSNLGRMHICDFYGDIVF